MNERNENYSEMDYSGNERAKKVITPTQEVELALKECGFGRFHVLVLASSVIGLIAGVLVTSITAYILPVAECDLDMNLIEKGLLNTMPYIGMTITSIVAGFLTDTFGRKIFLVSGFGGQFLVNIAAGTSQTYEVLLTAKLFEGILFSLSYSAAVTITSEFCHKSIRDRVMLLRSSFRGVSQILIAAMSWGILIQDWKYSLFNGYLELRIWNFYIYLMSFWSFVTLILYVYLPESPQYYITQNKYDEARKILIDKYVQNTGKPAETFKYTNLWKDRVEQATNEETSGNKTKSSFKQQLMTGFVNMKPIFKKPLSLYLLLLSSMNFMTMVLYNIIRLWFPQLSAIVEHYSDGDDQDLCVMLDSYTQDLNLRSVTPNETEICIPVVSGSETYINSIILGFVCLIPTAVGSIIVNKVGKKYLYIASATIATALTLALRWASSKVAIVALFSSDIAICQTLMSLFQASTMELFPTTTRSLAVSIIMTLGRIGTLVGNVAFPILLNMGCVVPFFTLTGAMLIVTLLSLFLPKS